MNEGNVYDDKRPTGWDLFRTVARYQGISDVKGLRVERMIVFFGTKVCELMGIRLGKQRIWDTLGETTY